MKEQSTLSQDALFQLLSRRSVSPKRLTRPGPSAREIDLLLQAAMRAPDHGTLHPWRVIEFRDEQRAQLARCFESEKLRRDPMASASDLRRAREHAIRPPGLLAFVVSPCQRSKVPLREQWLCAGAALGNLLNAAHQLDFGAIVLSGERCFDSVLVQQLGVGPGEQLAGFITIGRIAENPPPARNVLTAQVWSCWLPAINPKVSSDAASEGSLTRPCHDD
jgi:nitroreductase